MKTKLFVLVMVLGFCIASKAQSDQKILPGKQKTEISLQKVNYLVSQNETSNSISSTAKLPVFQSDMSQNPFSALAKRRSSGGKMKPWQYVAVGAVVVVVVVFTVIAPNGYNSRTGI